MLRLHNKTYPTIPTDASWLFSPADRLSQTPTEMLCEFGACVIGRDDASIKIAARKPGCPTLTHYVKQHLGEVIEWYQVSEADLAMLLRGQAIDFKEAISALVAHHSAEREDTTIPKAVDYLIQFAFREGASDIHIEPRRHLADVRFRLDGILHSVLSVPMETYPALVARLKIMAGLRTDETRRPQDGRIEPEGFDGSSLRVSIMPTLYGEKIVMRILDESSTILELSALGFSEAQAKIIRRNIDKPYGMIVASGPTGSGKTTSLYALLQQLKKDDVNIATLEDPIEFALPKVNQTQVNPDLGFSFAHGLRSLLRQDPDVILVGEIRDQETIAMAANASMTGHLVLTSMHTNDAASAFSRFMEMGVDDFMVASIVNLVVAQRLVRKLCSQCATTSQLDPIIIEKINERPDIIAAMDTVDPKAHKKLSQLSLKQANGCDACAHTGYHGRVGIYELLETNKTIHDLILEHAPAQKIQQAAEANGFESMIVDGVRKVLAGTTTFEEVLRTTRTA